MEKTLNLQSFLLFPWCFLQMAALKATSREQCWERRNWLGLGRPKCQNWDESLGPSPFNTSRPLMIQLTAYLYAVAFHLCKPMSKSYLEQYKSVVGQWMSVSKKALQRAYPKGCQTLNSDLSHRINPQRTRPGWQFLCRCIAWAAWGSTHNTCSGTPDWSWTTAISPSF